MQAFNGAGTMESYWGILFITVWPVFVSISSSVYIWLFLSFYEKFYTAVESDWLALDVHLVLESDVLEIILSWFLFWS
jgi:hypothetical protein